MCVKTSPHIYHARIPSRYLDILFRSTASDHPSTATDLRLSRENHQFFLEYFNSVGDQMSPQSIFTSSLVARQLTHKFTSQAHHSGYNQINLSILPEKNVRSKRKRTQNQSQSSCSLPREAFYRNCNHSNCDCDHE